MVVSPSLFILLRQKKNGQIELGVHIADVSHFVQAGSLIDREAASRHVHLHPSPFHPPSHLTLPPVTPPHPPTCHPTSPSHPPPHLTLPPTTPPRPPTHHPTSPSHPSPHLTSHPSPHLTLPPDPTPQGDHSVPCRQALRHAAFLAEHGPVLPVVGKGEMCRQCSVGDGPELQCEEGVVWTQCHPLCLQAHL